MAPGHTHGQREAQFAGAFGDGRGQPVGDAEQADDQCQYQEGVDEAEVLIGLSGLAGLVLLEILDGGAGVVGGHGGHCRPGVGDADAGCLLHVDLEVVHLGVVDLVCGVAEHEVSHEVAVVVDGGDRQLFRIVDSFAAGALSAFGLVNAVAIMGSTAMVATAFDVAHNGAFPAASEVANSVQMLYVASDHFWGVGSLFFGLWLIPMGWLVIRSRWLPFRPGQVLIVGGFGYGISAFVTSAFGQADVVSFPKVCRRAERTSATAARGVGTAAADSGDRVAVRRCTSRADHLGRTGVRPTIAASCGFPTGGRGRCW